MAKVAFMENNPFCSIKHDGLDRFKSVCYTITTMIGWIFRKLRFIVTFSAAFTASSFLFSFLSWGQAAPRLPGIPDLHTNLVGLLVHMAEHAALGALAALPTRRAAPILTVALCAMLIDVDHTGSYIGLPMEGRANHSITFAIIVPIVMSLLARKGAFGRDIAPVIAGSLTLATVLAHLALDTMTGDPLIPIWSPFSEVYVAVPYTVGILLEIIAIILVWAATRRSNYQRPWGFFSTPD